MAIYRLKITLKNISPSIWRRFLVSSSVKMSDLHKIIQTLMGWDNCHLHQFIVNGEYYAPEFEDIEQIGIDYKKIRLKDLVYKEGQKFFYDYDFGDGWEHVVVLEKISQDDKNFRHPLCLGGKRSAPLENCGSIPGYENLLEALKDPDNKKYEEIFEWLGPRAFEPEAFYIDEINSQLKEKDYGCFSFD